MQVISKSGLRPRHTSEILIVDDNSQNVQLLSEIFERHGHQVQCAPSGRMALRMALIHEPDLILMDIRLPDVDGYDVCRQLKSFSQLAPIPIIFVSGLDEAIDKMRAFEAGGVDYVTKPFHAEEVLVRVNTHLRIRHLQSELEEQNRSLKRLVQEQITAIVESHLATIFALAKLAEYRDDDTGKHIRRVQAYCEVLARQMRHYGSFTRYIDDVYMQNLIKTAALHDIGKVGIPDHILLKPGELTPEEQRVMQTHTTIGARTLDEVLRCHPENRFIKMGVGIARSHHEKWDGTGYPDGLTEDAIPLTARLLTIADHYDALRNARPYKKPMDHRTACAIILDGDERTRPSHFDPMVLRAFTESRGEVARVYSNFQDSAVAV